MDFQDHIKKRKKLYKIYKQKRFLREQKGQDNSTSEDEEGNKNDGYQMTPYMLEYNASTKMDYTEGYDPKSLDQKYKTSKLYDKHDSEMPETLDFAFDIKYSGIEISRQDIIDLEEYFMKFQSTNTEIIRPKEILKTFKKHNIDKENPSMYSMMKWMADANLHSGTDGMTFEEVIQYCAYFYSQRSKEEGLKYVFELFDPQRVGFLTRQQLENAFSYCGIILERPQLEEMFVKASSDGKTLKFSEFAFFMRTTNM